MSFKNNIRKLDHKTIINLLPILDRIISRNYESLCVSLSLTYYNIIFIAGKKLSQLRK